jgi:hypothetical protein
MVMRVNRRYAWRSSTTSLPPPARGREAIAASDAAGRAAPGVTGVMNRGARFPVALANDLARELARIDTAPRSILAADRAQGELLAVFDRHGHAAGSFLRIYHGITVAVIAALEDRSLVPRPFFERLAGRFAEKHFDGVKAALGLDTTSDAARYRLWEPSLAFDNKDAWSLADGGEPAGPVLALDVPLAHFLVGMSCHINFDLAVSLEETIRELELQGDPEALDQIERGHDFVDSILAEQVQSSLNVLADVLGCPLSRLIVDANLIPLAGGMAMDVIRTWRARTFPAARLLLAAPTADARRRRQEFIYSEGARTTAELFELLPDLMGMVLYPDADRALAVARSWSPSPAARSVLRRLDGAALGSLGRAARALVDPAGRVLAAASRGVRSARVALDLLDVVRKLQRLAIRS